jgi:hypothetical protein
MINRRNFLQLVSATGGIFLVPSVLAESISITPKIISTKIETTFLLDQTFTFGTIAEYVEENPIIIVELTYDNGDVKRYETDKRKTWEDSHTIEEYDEFNEYIGPDPDNTSVDFDGENLVYRQDGFKLTITDLKECND